MREDAPPVPGRVDAGAIYSAVREDVVSGRLPPGTPAREVALAQRFGVSRTPVREALRRLEHDRLLVATPRGLVVRAMAESEVLQIYDLRVLLEGEAAHLAAESRSASDLLRLEALLSRDSALAEPDEAQRVHCASQFHAVLWEATHNEVLEDLLHRLTVHLVRGPRSTLSGPGRWEQALEEHADILEAVRRRDGVAARAAAALHLDRARAVRAAQIRATGPGA